MKLLLGVSGLTLAVMPFALLLIGVRNPKPARWKAEGLIANAYAPLIIALGIFGVGFIVRWSLNLAAGAVNWQEIGLAGVVALAGAAGLKLRRRSA